MKETNLSKIYQDRKQRFDQLVIKQKRTLQYISLMRLAVIILAVWLLVLGVKHERPVLYIVSGLMLVLFFMLVIYHKNQSDRRKLLAELKLINHEELKSLENDQSAFDDGAEFIDSDHPWSYDLDLFGEGSLYQSMNRTATHTGPENLAEFLNEPVLDEQEIRQRQEVIRELAGRINLRQNYAAHARLMKKVREEYEEVLNWSEQDTFIEKYQWTRIAAWIMTIISSTSIIMGILNPGFFSILIWVALINFTLLSPFVLRTSKFQSRISRKHRFLSTYAELLGFLSDEEFEHASLRETAEQCSNGSQSVDQLSRLLNLFDHRLNFIVGITLNALFLFDFHMLHRLSAWNRKYHEDLKLWLALAGRADALFSLANFTFNHFSYHIPEVRAESSAYHAKNIGHPLIPEEKRVDNSIEIRDEKVVLITGANMAGKSTFLRAVGVNMVLAYAGCPVCAEEFSTGTYRLYSSMRTADSLKDEESYFFAEIKRLKKIVMAMEEGQKLLILLDEVLKGTNTTDKQKGSRGLIEKSVRHDVLCFIATHDLALGKMEDEHKGKVVNYCFESYIKDLELTFDYSIRPGLAKNMNASFLMKKMGIMD